MFILYVKMLTLVMEEKISTTSAVRVIVHRLDLDSALYFLLAVFPFE